MTIPETDSRSPDRRARDEAIAAEPPLAPPELSPGATASPVEAHLGRTHGHPLAVAGIVENGLVRPLDPEVKLPEHSRVIIVASEETGTISVSYRGRLSRGLDEDRLRRFLSALLLKGPKSGSAWKRAQEQLDLTPEGIAKSEQRAEEQKAEGE